MVYTSETKLPLKEEGKEYYFLAGSIDLNLTSNWRNKIIEETKDLVHFFDPTRFEHNNFNDSEMKAHIEWELNAMNLADKIILNFLPESKSPISLVELGLNTKTDKLVVVCPNAFYQSRYIKVLCEKYRTPFFYNLDDAVSSLNSIKRKENAIHSK